MTETLKWNMLPVYTYNRLGVNEDKTINEKLNSVSTTSIPPASVPDGVTLLKAQEEDKVKALFKEARERIAASEKDSVPPNGDTSAINKDSAIPSAMGGAADMFFEGAGVKTDIYTVEANTKVEDFLILNYHLEDNDTVCSRQVLHLKKGAELTVIMDYHTHREDTGFLGIQTRVLLEEGAKLYIVKAQMLGERYLHLDDMGGVLFDNANCELVRMDLGSSHATSGCRMDLLGDGAVFDVNDGYLCRRDQKYDMNYIAVQRGKKTDAKMVFSGVLQDKGEKTFRGTLDFKKGSSGARGEEQEDTLILSPDVVNRAIPLILCQEEDVEGHHGATIGQLEPEVLFYFETRGIDAEEAKRIMVRARLLTVSRLIPERHLRGHVEDYLRKQL